MGEPVSLDASLVGIALHSIHQITLEAADALTAVPLGIAFIAGSAFGLEAMLDVASRLADDKSNDIRIEAALAKLFGSEMGWKVLDELIQIRGGRGYETAASLKARG